MKVSPPLICAAYFAPATMPHTVAVSPACLAASSGVIGSACAAAAQAAQPASAAAMIHDLNARIAVLFDRDTSSARTIGSEA